MFRVIKPFSRDHNLCRHECVHEVASGSARAVMPTLPAKWPRPVESGATSTDWSDFIVTYRKVATYYFPAFAGPGKRLLVPSGSQHGITRIPSKFEIIALSCHAIRRCGQLLFCGAF